MQINIIKNIIFDVQIALLEDQMDEPSFMQTVSFSEWLDEFFCRLFSLLQHLEPSSVL